MLFSFPLPFPTRFLAACVNPICKFLDVHIYISHRIQYEREGDFEGKWRMHAKGVGNVSGVSGGIPYWAILGATSYDAMGPTPPPTPLSHSLSKLRVKRVRKTEIVQGGMGLKLRVTVRVRMNIGRKGGLLKRRTKPDT